MHDSDLDGDPDLIASSSDQQAALLLNNGNGAFSTASSITGPFAAVADFNGDGLLDDVVQDPPNSSNMQIRLNRGDSVFETVYVIQESDDVDTSVSAIRDVDGNGYEDVVTSAYFSFTSFRWVANDAGDINDDGQLDFACSSGSQLWLDGSTLTVNTHVEPTPIGDVNGDGVFAPAI